MKIVFDYSPNFSKKNSNQQDSKQNSEDQQGDDDNDDDQKSNENDSITPTEFIPPTYHQPHPLSPSQSDQDDQDG